MKPDPGAGAAVVVVGGGLAGALLALALRERGLATELIDADLASATALSYGAMAPWAASFAPMGRLIRGAPRRWRQLQRRHGPLGWHPAWFRPIGPGAPLGGMLPLPCSRVEAPLLVRRLPQVLRAAGVELTAARVRSLQPASDGTGGWRLELESGERRRTPQLVLAAGAGCRALWPGLTQRLRVSWAGVLELEPGSGPAPAGGGLRLPARFGRLALEARAPELEEEAWTVDPGLLPWDGGWLAGQISLVRPGLEPGPPPDAGLQERRLRDALAPLDRTLASRPGRFRQVPVTFCPGGLPLVGPLQPEGLWLFSGFSGAFAQVPVLAPLLAGWIAARHDPGDGGADAGRQNNGAHAGRRLLRLGVVPDASLCPDPSRGDQ
ncbi:FAD-dependent oxidoreductase [Cyanobium sp. CH-040]|uniref:FAD-dependent oxidoreductase n=1 Tax=Cyanobium sp. CH-040 TaxID=2823708 RepID=UPI0020CC9887|nr:FAD-dependent oxidoreductase [Cyanobium sp. CH-040]MCP9927672.1 FAD-binding oxidoreductase [Cyanobium sp. CH-040]